MGSIIARKRNDGTFGYRAQIILKRGGKIAHREAKTFDRREAAKAWVSRRETELAEPGALDRSDDPVLGDVIDRYVAESKKKIGKTKAQVLNRLKKFAIADIQCSKIKSEHCITLANSLLATGMAPQTVQNYLSHLGAIFAVARPAWGYQLDRQALRDACVVARRMGITSKSKQRNRRPTLDELNSLMEHFGTIKAKRPSSIPMQKIVAFAIFSTRRQEEITTLRSEDFDEAHSRILVRDMKHPGDKIGNDTWCELVPEAMKIIKTMKREGRLFPYGTDAISAAFTRACKFLEIKDLHFHDLRHDGISRLFEMGRTIPQAASVSGHRSWASLKRYTHIRQAGDKYENWKWLDVVTK